MLCSIKSKRKIETLFNSGKVVKVKGLLIRYYSFNDNEVCFGVSVPKKLFPSAVKRNLIKRRLRVQTKKSGLGTFFNNGASFFVIYGASNVLSSKEILDRLEKVVLKLKAV